jgi:transcriptional regulator with XRE-family HTH domain
MWELKMKKSNTYAEQFALASIALVLADALEESGISQRQLAERLGVSEARVSQILSADHNLTVKVLAKIANALQRELKIEMPLLENPEQQTLDIRGAWKARRQPWLPAKGSRPPTDYVERELNEAA